MRRSGFRSLLAVAALACAASSMTPALASAERAPVAHAAPHAATPIDTSPVARQAPQFQAVLQPMRDSIALTSLGLATDSACAATIVTRGDSTAIAIDSLRASAHRPVDLRSMTARAVQARSQMASNAAVGNGAPRPSKPYVPLSALFMIGMTALVGERNTPRKDGVSYSYPVDAAKKIYKGAIVVLNAGHAAPGSTALNLVCVGRSTDTIDNSLGAAGDLNVTVENGVFRFANSAAGDLIALSDVGTTCYIVDDQTVAKTNGGATRSAAGIIRDVDAAGVWVEID